MKALLTFCFSLLVCTCLDAQTTLYTQTFETSYSDWTLTSTDMSAVSTPNYWTVTNVYSGGSALYVTTPDEPSGITSYPESYYMHIRSNIGPANATFNASGNHVYLSAMNAPIVTTGYTNVNISFWWLCRGNASCFGRLFYRTSASSTAWIQVSTASTPAAALDSFNNSYATWTLQTIHVDAFDNQPFLEFAYEFHNQNPAGTDPSFAVDDITVVGTPGVPPVASFTQSETTACQDSCITETSTTPGTLDSVRWSISPTAGATIATPTASVTSVCFTTAGTYSVTLTAYNSGGSNAVTHTVDITPSPHPVITQSGHTLSVASAGMYSAFQWIKNGATIIAGATNSTYTYSVSATYNVVVDSDGCFGISNTITGTVGVPLINNGGDHYWLSQTDHNTVNLFASLPLNEALNVTIYDATGRKMLSDIWNNGATTRQISSGFLPPGLYIVRLSNNNTSAVLRFTK